MKKAIIPATILCTVLCIGLGNQPGREAEPTPTPPQVKVSESPMPETEIEVITATPTPVPVPTPTLAPTPAPTPTPAATLAPAPSAPPAPDPITSSPVQAGDMVYVPGFGWLESQGEGTVTYAENMYENGNKVGIMD